MTHNIMFQTHKQLYYNMCSSFNESCASTNLKRWSRATISTKQVSIVSHLHMCVRLTIAQDLLEPQNYT